MPKFCGNMMSSYASLELCCLAMGDLTAWMLKPGVVMLKHMVSGSHSPKQMSHASMVTHLFNQVSNFLHPFAIWLHYHELVLGSFAFLTRLSAAVQAADASVNMLHVQLWHDIYCQQQAAASYKTSREHSQVQLWSHAWSVTQGSDSDLAACTGHRHNAHKRNTDKRQD